MRLVRETYHDRQGEEALAYLYESNSYVQLALIDPGKPAAYDADARDEVNDFHNDVSGLPEALTDADGELIWQARYKMWGNSVQEEWIAGRRNDRRRHGVRCRKLGYVCPCTTAAELAFPRAVP
ncbi:RHS domain-containing protein [Burkholderia cepacia]|uniref:RHS domain-containing protein n=1 Tax=Burkholderia cepacia TaxID=292 RepID=UPI001F2D891D|nr:RHS domain-containing protein [Burkholderia cepacia]MCE4127370.1 RHS domain-containing protein [Burkholderia cepacia]